MYRPVSLSNYCKFRYQWDLQELQTPVHQSKVTHLVLPLNVGLEFGTTKAHAHVNFQAPEGSTASHCSLKRTFQASQVGTDRACLSKIWQNVPLEMPEINQTANSTDRLIPFSSQAQPGSSSAG
ncbi:unnamed protein product [Rhizoctonia solani]|uniref:Uncharacterized protein n=1 Tax=Rhizoctonia solani TaxID=456999 RepID=A0A8H3BBY5_9AGAM|nr:unnamed protein product [Rhizoctonia solani]